MRPLDAVRSAWTSWWSPRWADGQRAPWWAHVLATFLFGLGFALALTAAQWVLSAERIDLPRTAALNLVIAQCIAFSIHALFALAGELLGAERIDAWSAPRRTLFFSLLPLLGLGIGYAAAFTLLGWARGEISFGWLTGRFVFAVVLLWAALATVWWRVYRARLRLAEAQRQRDAQSARAERAERQALQARLSALQAQVEPHFFFNTLAHVAGLIETQPHQARAMIERLADLLRAALANSRAPQTTLGDEIELVRAYLEIMAIRMGGRLTFEIRADKRARACAVPPLLLQPLVENAVRHGLEPKVGAGRVRVIATADDRSLELTVEDDGVGFSSTTPSDGVGLTNLRERLQLLYGGAARLAIEDLQPGTRVRIRVPTALEPPLAPH